MDIDLKRIAAAVLAELGPELTPDDRDFMLRVYGSSIEVYRSRLRAVGMLDQGRVLDAGCGFGQWTLALGNGSNTVHGVDISPVRVKTANLAFRLAGLPGVSARRASLTRIPARDNSYDAVFAYSSVCFAPWKQSLKEMARVLRPGGRMYYMASDVGFAAMLWQDEPNKGPGYDPREAAALSLLDTVHYRRTGRQKFRGKSHIIVSRAEAREYLGHIGLMVERIEDEGTISLDPGAEAPQPFYKGSYYGLPGVYEVLCRKA
jgi:ubiquinone/menaquinone biosynthesis C-methylase UbiE